ncbi:E3 ubiquitin-protein ligase RNF19B-like [Oratosquilla oratoria]|uniref:E3 ubiquitin-protein ligase RNF19B-like n=1 Tax=Oratosquilla oratoria TaxID=337810 RepID=UPI003F776FF2
MSEDHHRGTRSTGSARMCDRGGGSSSGFPRMSLRSLLMSSPFSRRPRSRRVRVPTASYKVTIDGDGVPESSGVGSCAGETSSNEAPTHHSHQHHSGGSFRKCVQINAAASTATATTTIPSTNTSSRRGSTSGSRAASSTAATSRGGSCSSVGGGSDEGELRECPLCLQEVPGCYFPVLLSCPHSACMQCFKKYLTVEIMESRVNITCPQCHELMHPTDIHNIVDNEMLSFKFEDFMLRRVLSMDPDTRWCPAPDCGYAVIASGCAGCPKLKCERPGCESNFCYHCKAKWHPNQTCDMARAQRSPNIMFSSFNCLHDVQGSDDVKACPRCQVLIMKMDDGSCNHMTCTVCGAEFCWLCMKEISDLHYLSPSGCTFWGKKPWSRKKKILWQLGTLVGAPLGIGLVAGLAVPAMIIGIPIWVGRKLHARYTYSSKHRRNLAMVGGVTASALISPVLAGLAVSIGVPILLAYVYGVVPISLCRSGGCGVTTSASGVRIAFDDENDMVFGLPGRQSESSHVGGGTASIGEVSCGASLSADSAAHVLAESDRESASNTAIAPASLTASIASSYVSRTHRLEVHVDIAQGGRCSTAADTASLATSERSTHTVDTENASIRALAGSLLHYKVSESEAEASADVDSASGLMVEGAPGNIHITNLYLHTIPPSASENNSAVLPSDHTSDSLHTNDPLRLDSVSAIINARHLSRHTSSALRGVQLCEEEGSKSSHVALVVDDDDDDDVEGCSINALDVEGRSVNAVEVVDDSVRAKVRQGKCEGDRMNSCETHLSVDSDNAVMMPQEQWDNEVFRDEKQGPEVCQTSLPAEHQIVKELSSVQQIAKASSSMPQVNKEKKASRKKRRASSVEINARCSSKPIRSESFPKLESSSRQSQ